VMADCVVFIGRTYTRHTRAQPPIARFSRTRRNPAE
jgi:hypothetical protein